MSNVLENPAVNQASFEAITDRLFRDRVARLHDLTTHRGTPTALLAGELAHLLSVANAALGPALATAIGEQALRAERLLRGFCPMCPQGRSPNRLANDELAFGTLACCTECGSAAMASLRVEVTHG